MGGSGWLGYGLKQVRVETDNYELGWIDMSTFFCPIIIYIYIYNYNSISEVVCIKK